MLIWCLDHPSIKEILCSLNRFQTLHTQKQSQDSNPVCSSKPFASTTKVIYTDLKKPQVILYTQNPEAYHSQKATNLFSICFTDILYFFSFLLHRTKLMQQHKLQLGFLCGQRHLRNCVALNHLIQTPMHTDLIYVLHRPSLNHYTKPSRGQDNINNLITPGFTFYLHKMEIKIIWTGFKF